MEKKNKKPFSISEDAIKDLTTRTGMKGGKAEDSAPLASASASEEASTSGAADSGKKGS